MKLGISTACLYPLYLEQAAAILAEAHVPTVEVFINAPSELESEYLRKIRAVLDEGGTKVLSLHPFTCGLEPMLFFSEYRRRYEDGLELYRRYFEAAALLGARYFILHGDRRDGDLSDEEYFERYEGMDRVAREYGIRVAQENVARCRSGSLDFLIKMKQQLPDTVFTLDLKQARRAGADWRSYLTALGENIRHIHLSGSSETEDCLPVTGGHLDGREFLTLLQSQNFQGGILLELYRSNYKTYGELFESLHYMEKLCNELL